LWFVKSLILDLVSKDWALTVDGRGVRLRPPSQEGSADELKERVRRGHVIERDAQLRRAAIGQFISEIERKRLYNGEWHSIFSLMRDGRELSNSLAKAASVADPHDRENVLASAIQPYIQFVDGRSECEFTGLALSDIWRYFRYTWTNAYKTVPGRSVMILVRDAAARNHPVVGIAALASSVVQQTIRDEWIGWESETFADRLISNPSLKIARWLLAALDGLIAGIYSKDLLSEGMLVPADFSEPQQTTIDRLRDESARAIEQHRRFPRPIFHKSQNGGAEGDALWEQKARTSLFRSKRCKSLATLFSIKRTFRDYGLVVGSKKELKAALKSKPFASSVGQLIRLVKAEHVGIDMMDIIVCGAIPPYNAVLGGKLVCMLLCSPEVVNFYAEKYRSHVSIIASSMKGEPIQRNPNLVLLGTTSLYGSNLNQYSRVSIPAEVVCGQTGDKVEYKKLGFSEGFGSFHFSQETLDLIGVLLARSHTRKVNSIFGEGVNPLMRKIREALDLVKLPSDLILRHGNRRVVYGVALARNFREALLGLHRHPKYLIPRTKPQDGTALIAQYWRKRWLSSRIRNPKILEEVSHHNLAYPVTHGARVPSSPQIESEPSFFEEE